MLSPLLADLHTAAERLWQQLSPDWPGVSIEILPSVDSTNAELMRRVRGVAVADPGPVLLLALEQTQGRGRRGRPWQAQPGECLMFSLGLPLQPTDWSGLSLVVGISLAEALSEGVQVKWPNDLWCQDRKLGGILIETAGTGGAGPRQVVVGVGINLRTPTGVSAADAAASGLPFVPPIGLNEVPGAPEQGPGAWLERLVPGLLNDLRVFERSGLAAFLPRFRQRDRLFGQPVRLSDGRTGRADGVAEDGALRLETATGIETVHHAEVSVRPC